jgi:hypothetical protein
MDCEELGNAKENPENKYKLRNSHTSQTFIKMKGARIIVVHHQCVSSISERFYIHLVRSVLSFQRGV